MKLCLGTAQFGSNYGISNKNGIEIKYISKILKFCRAKKINFMILQIVMRVQNIF